MNPALIDNPRRFRPTRVRDCVLWLDPQRLAVGSVASAPNLGTLGGTLDQGTGAARPTNTAGAGPSGGNALVFDGGDFLASSLAASAWNPLHSSGFHVFIVFSQTATGNAFYGLLSTSTTAAGSRGIGVYWDNRSSISLTANLRTAVSNGSTYVIDPANSGINNGFAANAWSVLELRYEAGISGDDFSTRRSGTSIKTAETSNAASASNAANTLLIGCLVGATSNGLVGSMADICAFNRALSTTEASYVRRGLGAKNSLVVT